jgi:hypothetical protein
MIKPGYKTSEFWFTLVSFLFSGLYLVGLIGENGQKEDLIRDVSHGVESVILIGGQLAILWKYVNSRKEIKQTWWSTATEEERSKVAINNRKKESNISDKPIPRPTKKKISSTIKKRKPKK